MTKRIYVVEVKFADSKVWEPTVNVTLSLGNGKRKLDRCFPDAPGAKYRLCTYTPAMRFMP
jgi:hypothetical protein